MNINEKINKRSSETIPMGSRVEKLETVSLFKFYVLIDPRDNKIKYLGRTVDEKNRFRNHIYEAKRKNRSKKERWIMYLLRRNMKPKLKVIYTLNCNLEEAIETEKAFIKNLLRNDYHLKNMPDNYGGALLTGTPVYQYDLEGKFIKEFSNSNQAYIDIGVKDCNIARCCKNENGYGCKTAGDFFWSYIKYEEYPHIYIRYWRERKGKAVLQFDLNNRLINEFSTARIADKATGIPYKKISACCNNRQKTTKGFIWKFK